jgi:nitrate reductase gamma subunit
MVDLILLIFCFLCAVVFLAAVAYRGIKTSRLPMHLRWELYPVAHEKGRASYGGSYLEEPDWWTKPREASLLGELCVMIPEILLLAGVWEHNRKHWFRSFPFHFGLYLLAGLIGLLVLGGIATAAGADVSAGAGLLGMALYHLTYLVGYAGLILALAGATALLVRRTVDEDYREYTKKADYFNLVFFVVTFSVALITHALFDPDFAALRGFFARMVNPEAWSTNTGVASTIGPLALEIVLGALLLAYIPLTHMSHFFMKWFTYHHVRWSDEPNLPGGKIDRQIGEMLQYPVGWSAPHIRGDGKKTWADVATSAVEEEETES